MDKEIAYTNDKVGRLTKVGGTSFGNVTEYAKNPQYRAWGALKHLDYGNGFDIDVTYNNRLQAATFNLDNTGDSNPATFDKTYEYYNDGMLKLVDNLGTDAFQNRFDRLFTYDFAGRTITAKSGVEAHGGTETNLFYLPYRQAYTHDAFGHVKTRESTLWNYTEGDWDFYYNYTGNRVDYQGYDLDGRQTYGDETSFIYNASGQMVSTSKAERYEATLASDGIGRETKRSTRGWDSQASQWKAWETSYFVYSTVLGQMVSEVNATGKKKGTYVIAAGAVIAKQFYHTDGTTEYVGWKHTDPSGLSTRALGGGMPDEELDALGNNVGLRGQIVRPERHQPTTSPFEGVTFDDMTIGDCQLDGIIVPCSMLGRMSEALQLERRYHDGSRFVTDRIDLNFDLPGRRHTPIWIENQKGRQQMFEHQMANGTNHSNKHLTTASGLPLILAGT